MSERGTDTSPVAVLMGAPGSGKSTVGPLLAERLGVGFRDVDHDIEAAEGKAISEIFIDDGEPHFRELEHQAVVRALAEHDGVLSLGGGAVLDERTREALRGHRVVWLVVGLATAAERVGLGTSRPVLALNPRATLRHLLEQRTPLYEEAAQVRIDTNGKDAEAVADEIAAALGTHA
ncbi:shikimate kinase [Epidermidibacterium keratini]|uniref:Shikimate kinase n=1 Tax=Epidermidibacterium keratini TaxID=1891644 RepID=A0A7L4YJL5_9ACTN|nr:shikimate kinase [Epidermidibacterium keratini]QHB99043.1 shikimate kinase [Epidermidibacterium keratini]